MAHDGKIISADSHIEVPPDVWSSGIPERYAGLAPKRITLPTGGDGFIVEGGIYQGGSNLYAGIDPKEYNPIGLKWDEAAGTGGPDQRLRELDQDGIDSEWMYPGVGGVRNITKGIKDPDGYHALIRTYNRWLAEDFCSLDPDRLVGVGCIPDRTLAEALDEVTLQARADRIELLGSVQRDRRDRAIDVEQDVLVVGHGWFLGSIVVLDGANTSRAQLLT